ncbi:MULTISPECIES: DUF2127 domain-containing protein [Lactococcus]|uniref:Predicted membrane protein n=1 Tax=Lactococcus lactis subsp. lactis TaxID=1360 RepID=A0A0B8QYS6_LACLL|nr:MULTISPECIES: DUF2127 domain-containing protein [Lactococcus]KAF6609862.1 DUF2127 domain-containing protein [Lactococcus sp. EKM201L]KAF6612584.1 DUF2127 domain-containing protein [Lactococcus sp. EKM203L]KAF6643072.1 DUF2127 domain-containing protein [Lactococcus sp. EKM501L]KAF6646617.1 DUF2127 domain-containing protein [Lactococcus sp. EKM502L]KAF6652668.1 DUF2127 domain-containing protein [Lactococcus sp. EKM101L]
MNKVKNKEELLDVSFNTMLLGKSIFAFVEFISGLLLIFVPLDLIKATIHHLALAISLSSFSTMITNAGERLTNDATLFAIVYLLLHGALKLVTLALLWKKILWSYPLSILLLVGFILYQIFEFFNHGSISMLVLCAVDVLMIILTLLEYRKLKAHISKEGSYSSLKNSKVN